MKNSFFIPLLNAVTSRTLSLAANLFLRHLAVYVAFYDSRKIAAMEMRIKHLQERDCSVAAEQLSQFLCDYRDDDPSYAVSTCFARQLFADSIEVDTPQLRAEPEAPPVTRHSLAKSHLNSRFSHSA